MRSPGGLTFLIRRAEQKGHSGASSKPSVIQTSRKKTNKLKPFRQDFPADVHTLTLGCCGPGKFPKKESLQKWLGEGAKGLLDSFGPRDGPCREQRSPKSLLHHPNPLLHRCNPISHQRFRKLSFSGNFPGLQLPNAYALRWPDSHESIRRFARIA